MQGAEADVLEAGRGRLDDQVVRVHVGTHNAGVEQRIRELFLELGWTNRYDFAAGAVATTPYGVVAFQDGVQSWLNPRFAPQRA